MLTKKQQLYKALVAQFQADKEEALTAIQIFLDSPVGVAEHTTFVKDVKEQVKKLSEAEESLQTLEKIVKSALDVE